MFPKEHGAYGQLLFPLLTAIAIGRPNEVALLLTGAAVCAFLAHEPLLVLLGQRGARATREQRGRASIWFGAFSTAAAVSGGLALRLASTGVRAAFVFPAVLAAILAVVILLQYEHTAAGEIVAAVSFSTLAWPVALAAGAPAVSARTAAAVFAAVFVSGTLGVRAVIAQTRRTNAAIMRAAALIAAAAAVALLWWTASAGRVAPAAPWAALPACALTALLAAAAPPAKQLRTVGWALVATTTAAALVLAATLR